MDFQPTLPQRKAKVSATFSSRNKAEERYWKTFKVRLARLVTTAGQSLIDLVFIHTVRRLHQVVRSHSRRLVQSNHPISLCSHLWHKDTDLLEQNEQGHQDNQ
jgi:hypothetical protein